MTILRPWSHGMEVWSLEGMHRLWSAPNVKIYGGGVSEAGYRNEHAIPIGCERKARRFHSGRSGTLGSERYQ